MPSFNLTALTDKLDPMPSFTLKVVSDPCKDRPSLIELEINGFELTDDADDMPLAQSLLMALAVLAYQHLEFPELIRAYEGVIEKLDASLNDGGDRAPSQEV